MFLIGVSQSHAQSAAYKFIASDDFLQDRIAYLLTVFEEDPGVRGAVKVDGALQRIGNRLVRSRREARELCAHVPSCSLRGLMLSEAEIQSAGEALARLARPGGPLRPLVTNHLRPSGRYQKFAALDDSGFLRAAWLDVAKGINGIYGVYELGTPSFDIANPKLFEPRTEQFAMGARAALDDSLDGAARDTFFTPWAQLAFALLRINNRDDAVLWEPVDKRENAAAKFRADYIEWTTYRYTAILVPSLGLNVGERGLSPGYAYTLRMAARRWRAGLAPYLILTGGPIHPDRSPYTAAVEGKKFLMTQLNVPEEAILVDPYARHTTTDLRNAVRLLFRIHAPMERHFLVTSNLMQVDYIASAEFAERCRNERGMKIATIADRVSPYDVSALPDLNALSTDPQDPLDP
jgi:hypothetical protein